MRISDYSKNVELIDILSRVQLTEKTLLKIPNLVFCHIEITDSEIIRIGSRNRKCSKHNLTNNKQYLTFLCVIFLIVLQLERIKYCLLII